MKTLTIRHLTLGSGQPKIAVPLVARDEAALSAALKNLEHACFDIIEFRADYFDQAGNPEYLLAQAEAVRRAFPETPLLFTFRQAEEGGEYPCSKAYYFELLDKAAASGIIDIIDIELSAGESEVCQVVAAAKAHDTAVLMSNHDFHQTPAKSDITGRLKKMEEAGADICKIAVMPQSPADVLTLLGATWEARQTANRPIVTISMGKLGLVSRIAGSTFGSAITFGTAGTASAPGQLDSANLKNILDVLENGNTAG